MRLTKLELFYLQLLHFSQLVALSLQVGQLLVFGSQDSAILVIRDFLSLNFLLYNLVILLSLLFRNKAVLEA